MIILKKKARIILVITAFSLVVATGCFVERYGRDAFITETVTEDDRISYTEEGEMIKDGKININTADVETLSKLYGIDEKFGQRIVDYRAEHGRYETIEEIMKVPGIGDGMFGRIKDNITVE